MALEMYIVHVLVHVRGNPWLASRSFLPVVQEHLPTYIYVAKTTRHTSEAMPKKSCYLAQIEP
jgi:hypothetical protein